MMNASKLQQYQNLQLQSMSPIDRIIWCYNKIILALRDAGNSIKNNDYEGRYNNLEKAKDFINILCLALDFENGKEVAKSLHRFYENMYAEITYVNMSKTPEEKINNIILQFDNMKMTWVEIKNRPIA